MPEIGDAFRAARLARHLSASEVSEQLHIRAVYLEAIENQEWALIGAPVYVRGFIRTYARFLGLEPEPAVAAYNGAAGGAGVLPERAERTIWRERSRRKPSLWLWGAALAAAVLLGFVGYNFLELRAGHAHGAVPAIAAATPAAAAASPAIFHRAIATLPQRRPAPAAQRTLELRLTETSWLFVQIDGAKRLEGTFPPGTRKAFHGKIADVRTGNAGGVDLIVNGKELGTMGHPGGIAERSLALAEE